MSTSNVVVLVRVCGNAFAVVRNGECVRIRRIAVAVRVQAPPDQRQALDLLRRS